MSWEILQFRRLKIACWFSENFNIFAAFDRAIASAELRRNTVLREIEPRRDGLARRLAKASAKIIDAEVEEVPVVSLETEVKSPGVKDWS